MNYLGLIISLVAFSVKSALSQCKLEEGMYMPFVCKVNREGMFTSTGNILTPRHVLTVCLPYLDYPNQAANIHVTKVNYRPVAKKPKDFSTYQVSDGIPVKGNCYLEVDVRLFVRHPLCKPGTKTPKFEMYNAGVFVLKSELTDYKLRERIPVLPFMYSLKGFMSIANWFNTFRRARCQIPKYSYEYGSELPTFEANSAYKSVPLFRMCAEQWCTERADFRDHKYWACYRYMTSFNGTLLCMKAVIQPSIEMDYWDSNNNDTEKSVDCERSQHMMGAPVVCEAAIAGFVVWCKKGLLVATTSVTLRHFILQFLDTNLTMYNMDRLSGVDTTPIPVR